MQTYFADLHIHIGRTEKGSPVKISGSKELTFFHIAEEASVRKGLDMIGIIDCHAPGVQEEIANYLDQGDMVELVGGGIQYKNTTIILGSEIEVREPGMGPAHLLIYLPSLQSMQEFTVWMKKYMKNVELSSQRIYVPAQVLQSEVVGRGGIVIPAHIFTPHRSIYGSCTNRMSHVLDLRNIAAVELGLSADADMAGLISELDPFTFLTNSDAHSLPKIGREYNALLLESPNFSELVKALNREAGRAVTANYGLNPRLGKYHRTYCSQCQSILDETKHAVERCLYCGSKKIVRGVMDRILEVSDRKNSLLPAHRAAYHYQIPLEFIPGIGKRTRYQLFEKLGTEMDILHRLPKEKIKEAVNEKITTLILQAREGTLEIGTGGGGTYGKINS